MDRMSPSEGEGAGSIPAEGTRTIDKGMENQIREIEEFLEKANKYGYANPEASKSPSLRPASEDYHYEEGDYVYHDTYFGGASFIGEEIIYKRNIPIWGLNYYGYITSTKKSEKEVYDFLRQALMVEYTGIPPVRGPRQLASGDWEYRNSIDGDISNLTGTEEILNQGEVVYKAVYNGGLIS